MNFSNLTVLIGLLLIAGCNSYQPENGDIIFQTSRSTQSKAVQAATHSPYSHMGIVYVKNGRKFVFEASGTVRLTPLSEWIVQGKGSKYVVKRLIDADRRLSPKIIFRMMQTGKKFEGKPYDVYFEWNDERMYCSELVWKIYHEAAGIQLGSLEQLKDLDLSAPAVKEKLQERYGNAIPEHESVISPVNMFDSELLTTVFSN